MAHHCSACGLRTLGTDCFQNFATFTKRLRDRPISRKVNQCCFWFKFWIKVKLYRSIGKGIIRLSDNPRMGATYNAMIRLCQAIFS